MLDSNQRQKFLTFIAVCVFYMVGERGIEPRTSVLSGLRSNLLSYSPILTNFAPILFPSITTKINIKLSIENALAAII